MDWLGAIVAFVLIWWVALFCVLPWGATSYHEAGEDAEAGNAPSAPLRPRIGRKMWITTGLAIIGWLIYFAVVQAGWVDFDMFHQM